MTATPTPEDREKAQTFRRDVEARALAGLITNQEADELLAQALAQALAATREQERERLVEFLSGFHWVTQEMIATIRRGEP